MFSTVADKRTSSHDFVAVIINISNSLNDFHFTASTLDLPAKGRCGYSEYQRTLLAASLQLHRLPAYTFTVLPRYKLSASSIAYY